MSMKNKLLLAGLLFSITLDAGAMSLLPKEEEVKKDLSCIQRAQWVAPADLSVLNAQTLLQKAAQGKVVLLGEQHPDAVHHRWQLQTITQLYAYNPNIVLGFEMFPRRVQPVLDAWVRGELSEKEFLKKSDWYKVWKFDPELYLPLFRFARMNRLPMIALNVDMNLIGEISQKGWDNVSDDLKEGVAKPREALVDYRNSLQKIFDQHPNISDDEKADPQKKAERFERFLQSQLAWDGAMAQKLAEVQKMGGEPLMIGVIGSGHLENRHGIPYQLEGLGLTSTVLLPWSLGWDCKDLPKEYSDAIFGLEQMEFNMPKARPVLGVRIEKNKEGKGVRVDDIVKDSVAQKAGFQVDDIILKAAGVETPTPDELVPIIQRQAPGTWLPLDVERKGRRLQIIAKFPAGHDK